MAKLQVLVLHDEDIGGQCIGCTIAKEMRAATSVGGCIDGNASVGQVVETRTALAADVLKPIGSGDEPALDVVAVVANGADGIVGHDGERAVEGGHRGGADDEARNALRPAVGFECGAWQTRRGATRKGRELIAMRIVGDKTPRPGAAHGTAQRRGCADGGETKEGRERRKTALRVVAARREESVRQAGEEHTDEEDGQTVPERAQRAR